MDQLSELRAAVQSDLTVGAESSLFPATTIDLAINRAYRKIGAMYKWNETRDALKTSTISGREYYEYPQAWRPNSIWKIVVDSEDYGDPLTFKDYQFEQDNDSPSGLERMWTNYGKRFFIDPAPTTNGDKNISIWGYKFVESLSLDGDITIFSYSMPEINEAIVLEAVAILKRKGDEKQSARMGVVAGAGLISQEARSIVVTTITKIALEDSKSVRTTPQFYVPNFFPSGIQSQQSVRNIIGNF